MILNMYALNIYALFYFKTPFKVSIICSFKSNNL